MSGYMMLWMNIKFIVGVRVGFVFEGFYNLHVLYISYNVLVFLTMDGLGILGFTQLHVQCWNF
jgi:hypothetical protein